MNFESNALTIAKANATSSNFDTPWKLQFDKGYPYNVGILSPHVIFLQIHFQSGAPASLCDKMYSDDPENHICVDCEKPGYQGKGKNRPTLVMVMLGHVFDLVDKEGTSSKGTKFKENPFKIIEQSGGKGQVNFEKLNEALAADPQYLTFNLADPKGSVWRFKRLEEGGMATPTILAHAEHRGLKLKLDSLTPEKLEKYMTMPGPQVKGLIVSSYGNCKKDLLEAAGFVFPVETVTAPADDTVDSAADPIQDINK